MFVDSMEADNIISQFVIL